MKSDQTESSVRAALIGFVVVASVTVLLGSIFFSSSWEVLLLVAAGFGAATAVSVYHRSPDLTKWRSELLIGGGFALVIAHLAMIGLLGADQLGSGFIIPSLVIVPVVIAALSTGLLLRFALNLWVFVGAVVAVSLSIAPLILAVYADTILHPKDVVGYDPIWVFLVPPIAIAGVLAGTLFYALYPGLQEPAPGETSSS